MVAIFFSAANGLRSYGRPLSLKQFVTSCANERNKHRHGECKLDIPELQFLIMRHADEWRLLAKKEKDLKVEKKIRWKPPPVDWVKINIDGAFSERSGSGGWGVIARDDTGDAIFAAAGAIPASVEALHSELDGPS
ncbi:uncharacterized protein LOC124656284 [Lolium rigidum]|uniref:uncharacterized protein LOC124656284 n=1 Tax=Lolium rigidum TaxID=89674 RepID=UPI001F5C55B7|nr:uncharacterized protein LOC124656284 [Lolium rigidum]